MATLTIEGKKVKVDDAFLSMSPEEQAKTVDEIAAQIGVVPTTTEDTKVKEVGEQLAKTSADFFNKNDGALRDADSFIRGAADTVSFGFADEAAATASRNSPLNPDNYSSPTAALETISNLNPVNAVVNAGKQWLTGDEKLESELRRERAFQAQRDAVDPVASTAGRVTGALLGAGSLMKANAPFMAALPAEASLAAKTAQGAKAGALYSGLYGAGSGEGVQDRVEEGVTGALTGGVIGGAIPAVTAGVKAIAKPVTDAVKGHMRPEAFANRKIAERLSDAGLSPEQAAKRMASNPGMSLADIGGQTAKNLLKTSTNIPGPAAARVKTQLTIKQMQQGDRIKSAVKQTFADPDGYYAAKDKIAESAQKMAKPLYDRAYETPIPFTKSLEDILHTPAVKRALSKAQEKMANSQTQFRHMFANVADDGTVKITRVPDTQGWDYIKRALDDEIGMLKRSGANDDVRILTNLKNKMLSEIDEANPIYAQARKVWSSHASLDDALEEGRVAMTKSPEEVKRLMSGMSQAEKESFKIGVAEWIRKQVDGSNFTHNSLLKFFSNRGQLKNLKAAFDNDEQFKAFRQAIFSEARKRSTYNTVTGNSSTAKQLADMAEAGGLSDGVDFVQNAVTSGPVSASLRWIGSRMKMLGGFTPEVADQVAKKLMATDPAVVGKLTRDLMKIEQQSISADQKRQLFQRLITPMIAIPAQAVTAQ